MATQYAFGKIVTNGLVLAWDVADRNSYPGSGTTIYDISGNGSHGTLVNGVSFSENNGGTLITDGIDDYIYSTTPNLSETNYTVIGASRYISLVRPGQTYPGGRMINANANNWLLGHWGFTVDNYYANGTITGINGSISDFNWRIYVGNGDISGDSYSFYINNNLYASNAAGSIGPNGIMIGRYPFNTTEYGNGAFGFILVYNRILTTEEMSQNFNAKKSRFNL